MDNCRIACVIVTYNRKNLLKRCLDAVVTQTFKPKAVYIMDNASTDGTIDAVREWGYYKSVCNGIEFKYILNKRNEGGAGGFYLGMKTANEDAVYDGLWVMDDDGVPNKNCLQNQVAYLNDYAFISPFVVTFEDENIMSFWKQSASELRQIYPSGIIPNKANPFNGILYRKDLIEQVGYPKPDLFIWGDEYEYQLRAISKGFNPVIIINAVHHHPKDRMEFQADFCGRNVIVHVSSDLRNYCCYRNRAYIYKKYFGIKSVLVFLFSYTWFFMITKRLSIKNLIFFWRAAIAGLTNNFSDHYNYIGR